MHLIAEGTVTVAVAGTPVAITALTKGLTQPAVTEVVIYNNYSSTTIFAVGKSATVDANSTPPIGAVINPGESVRIPVNNNPESVYVDSNGSAKSASVHYNGEYVEKAK